MKKEKGQCQKELEEALTRLKKRKRRRRRRTTKNEIASDANVE
jgi:hypothetical protein